MRRTVSFSVHIRESVGIRERERVSVSEALCILFCVYKRESVCTYKIERES